MSFKFTEREIRALEENPEAYELLRNHHDNQITQAQSVDHEVFAGSILFHESRMGQLKNEQIRLEQLI